jgi:uncharacterized membrane protein
VPEFDKSLPRPSTSSISATAVQDRPSPLIEYWHKPVFILFLVIWTVNWVLTLLRVELPENARWIEGCLPVMLALTSLVALARRLPLQNVLMAGAFISGISAVIVGVGVGSGVPFGPMVYGDRLGWKIFGAVPWSLPLLWVALIINGRGVARLIMRPWRKTNYYGFWVIGLTCVLAFVFDLGWEAFGVRVKNYWVWQTPNSVPAWYTAPWVNFLGWLITALAILAFTIPWLINKRPVKQPIDYHPLIVWLLLNLIVASANAVHHLSHAVIISLFGNAVVAIYAIRGARW